MKGDAQEILKAIDVDDELSLQLQEYDKFNKIWQRIKREGKGGKPIDMKKPKIETSNILPHNIADSSAIMIQPKRKVKEEQAVEVKKKNTQQIKKVEQVQKKEEAKILKPQKQELLTRIPPPPPELKPVPATKISQPIEVPKPQYEPIIVEMPQKAKESSLIHSNSQPPVSSEQSKSSISLQHTSSERHVQNQSKSYSAIFQQRFDKKMQEYDELLSDRPSTNLSKEQSLMKQNAQMKAELKQIKDQVAQLTMLLRSQIK